MFRLAAIMCIGIGLASAPAQVTPRAGLPGNLRGMGGATMHTSLSGQFSIRELDSPGGYQVPLGNTPGARYVRVDPTLLAVSCERIKQAWLKEIGGQDNWQDAIYIELQRARTLNDEIMVYSRLLGRKWDYHVRLPDTVENDRLVTAIVETLMVEMANRRTERSVELPAWLGLGMSEEILRSAHIELVMDPVKPNADGLNIRMLTISGTNTNTLARAHEELRQSPPLTVEQLSWPEQRQLEGATGEAFRSSAQLFVHELLQLKDGPAAMRAFIEELPQHLNWQLSFLHAFRADFASQLDLEQWWALRVVAFTGRDISQTWTVEESWKKLEEIIHPVVEVRMRVEEMPLRTEVSLQTIIGQWDAVRQVGLLKEKSKQLYSLRSRVSQELAKLVDDYRMTIDNYLVRRERAGYLRTARAREILGPDRSTEEAIADLNLLDSIREDLRPKPPGVQTAATGGDVNH